jgi:hypothetical protein
MDEFVTTEKLGFLGARPALTMGIAPKSMFGYLYLGIDSSCTARRDN